MKVLGRSLAAALALGLGGWSVASATSAHARHATYGTLTVTITRASGTVWGKVSVKPIGKTCSAARCVYKHVKTGARMTLRETPVDSTTWPFGKWTLNGNQAAGTGATLHFKMVKASRAGAVYILPGGTLTIHITTTSGYYGSTVWGSVKVEPLGKTCGDASCTYKNVPLHSKETATETPTDSSTWPFSGWTFNGASQGKTTSVRFTAGRSGSLDANYCASPC